MEAGQGGPTLVLIETALLGGGDDDGEEEGVVVAVLWSRHVCIAAVAQR